MTNAGSRTPPLLSSRISTCGSAHPVYFVSLLERSALLILPIGSTGDPERVPSSFTPNTMTPPPELAIATMSLISSHHSPLEPGSNPHLNSICFDSREALEAFSRISCMSEPGRTSSTQKYECSRSSCLSNKDTPELPATNVPRSPLLRVQGHADKAQNPKRLAYQAVVCRICQPFGGEKGIRTLDRFDPITAYQAVAFSRSAISGEGPSRPPLSRNGTHQEYQNLGRVGRGGRVAHPGFSNLTQPQMWAHPASEMIDARETADPSASG